MKADVLFRKSAEIGPILRRLFTNTLFDSIFTQLGVIIGSGFAPSPDLHLILGTLLTSSVALGISTGVSVYESEILERERRITELEKALFRKLDNTEITDNYRTYAMILFVINFLTPIACSCMMIFPLLLASFNLLSIVDASWISAIIALIVLFAAGTYLGRNGKHNPLLKGGRMAMFGVLAFFAGYLIQVLI